MERKLAEGYERLYLLASRSAGPQADCPEVRVRLPIIRRKSDGLWSQEYPHSCTFEECYAPDPPPAPAWVPQVGQWVRHKDTGNIGVVQRVPGGIGDTIEMRDVRWGTLLTSASRVEPCAPDPRVFFPDLLAVKRVRVCEYPVDETGQVIDGNDLPYAGMVGRMDESGVQPRSFSFSWHQRHAHPAPLADLAPVDVEDEATFEETPFATVFFDNSDDQIWLHNLRPVED